MTPLPDVCCAPQQLGSVLTVSLVLWLCKVQRNKLLEFCFMYIQKKYLNKIPTNISNTSFDMLPMNSITNIGDLLHTVHRRLFTSS